jgi:hypothetical protein
MIKLLFIILSIYLIQEALSSTSNKSENESTHQCIDPTTEQLGELMFNYEKKFDGSFNLLDVEAVQKSLSRNLVILDSYLKIETLNEHKCVKNVKNENNYKGLCSWHNRFSYREDRYPHLLMSAVCNCRECDSITRNINDFEFSCQPLKKLYPALIRTGKCSLNSNIYEWKPALEYVQIACMCMRNGTNYPVV